MKAGALAVVALLFSVALAGCVDGFETRSEWAYEATKLRELGTGAGVRVAILDSGIDTSHPAFAHLIDDDDANGRLVAFRDFIDGTAGVDAAHDDETGHGSHVASILTSRGSSFTDKLLYGGISLKGGANHVDLMVARVCKNNDCDGQAIRDAIDWAIQNRAQVLSLSLGGRNAVLSFDDDALRAAVERAIDRGIVVIAAAGNGGPGAPENQRHSDVTVPGDVPDVIAVGAVDEDLDVAPFSSRGANGQCRATPIIGSPTGRCDPNKKPELVAPGVSILGAGEGGVYLTASGTSQATPFVTAAVALMLEGKARITDRAGVREVKAALVNAADPVAGQRTPHDNAYGYGLLDAAGAVAAYS